MDVDQIVSELKNAISSKDKAKVKKLIGPIEDLAVIKSIDERFFSTVVDKSKNKIDPINYAIDSNSEKIAIYLVEKSFPALRRYNKDDEHCDQWCYYEHLDDKCPAEYDAIDKANDAEFYDLKNLIKDIKAGKRKPGEGLLKVEETMTKTKTKTKAKK